VHPRTVFGCLTKRLDEPSRLLVVRAPSPFRSKYIFVDDGWTDLAVFGILRHVIAVEPEPRRLCPILRGFRTWVSNPRQLPLSGESRRRADAFKSPSSGVTRALRGSAGRQGAAEVVAAALEVTFGTLLSEGNVSGPPLQRAGGDNAPASVIARDPMPWRLQRILIRAAEGRRSR
jgi:hypothetical protein